MLILMSAPSLPNHAILSARTQKGAISAHVLGATSFKKMERHAKILMNVKPNNTIVSFSVSTPLEASHANAHLVLLNITQLVLITMNVVLSHCFVDQKEFAKTLLEVLPVNVKGDFLWILLD